VTQLRQMVLDELQRRHYAPITIKQYLRIIDEFAGYFGRPLEKLGPNHIRAYQAHLFRDRKLASRTVRQHVAALWFVSSLACPSARCPSPRTRQARKAKRWRGWGGSWAGRPQAWAPGGRGARGGARGRWKRLA
jgi:Phage integrase, N-terminal SAM-like domain